MDIKSNSSFKKNERIKKDKDFYNVFRNGEKVQSIYYKCFFLKNNNCNKIGIVVKKWIGNSVKRNYEKRIIREFYRKYKNELSEKYDLIFIITNQYGDFYKKELDFYNIIKLIRKNDKK